MLKPSYSIKMILLETKMSIHICPNCLHFLCGDDFGETQYIFFFRRSRTDTGNELMIYGGCYAI